MKKIQWENGSNNLILKGEDFYISYNPQTGIDHTFFTDLGNMMGGDLKDGEETALCYDGRFDILEGDFREEYEEAFPGGLEACKRVFKKHEESNRSNWTT